MASSVIKNDRLIRVGYSDTLVFNNATIANKIINISKAGYEPIGVVGWATGFDGYAYTAIKIMGNKTEVMVEASHTNLEPVTLNMSIGFDILYQPI